MEIKGMCSQLTKKYNLDENKLAVETVLTIVQSSDIARKDEIENLIHHLFSNDCKQWLQLVTRFAEPCLCAVPEMFARFCRKHGPDYLIRNWSRLIIIVKEVAELVRGS